jgi:hypothetical protein
MADYSFISQPQTPDSFKSLGSLMNMATQTQQLRNSQQDFQRGSVALSKEQQTLQPSVDKAVAEAQTAQTGAQGAQLRLKGDQMKTVLDNLGGLVQDPSFVNGDSQGQVKALMDAEDRMVASGVPREVARTGTAPLYVAAQHEPTKTRQLATNLIQVGLGSQGQANQNLVPAGQQQQPGGPMGPRGTPSVIQRDKYGSIQTNTMPVAGQPEASANAPLTYPQGENAETAKPLYALRDQAQALAAQAPSQHFNNKQILDLAPDAFTGTGSGKLASVMNAVGLGSFIPKSAEEVGPATAQLRHFIALQTEQNAAAQGANTDAARKLSAEAVLPNDSPEKAIKAITKVNDAYVSGAEAFNKGLQAAITNPENQKDIFAARDFQNAWSQTFDPKIFLLKNAKASGDTETIDKILGKPGSPERAKNAQMYADKSARLYMLSTAGRME